MSFPKSMQYIKMVCSMLSDPDSLVLDFFSGSATTAHAVMRLNAEDGGRRVFAHALGNRARQLLTVWANDSKARLSKTTASAGGFIVPGGAPMSTGSIPPIKVAEAKPADSPAETM